MMDILKVVKKGMLATIQDLGRTGYRKYGVPISGAMDTYAMVCGNLLLNNHKNTPVLEITYGAFECEFLSDCTIAVTGGDLHGRINGRYFPMWKTMNVQKGEKLSFSEGSGYRAYLAVKKGFVYPNVLGSTSTYVRAGFNSKILDGDILSGKHHSLKKPPIILAELKPDYRNTIRVIPGPHTEFFPADIMQKLSGSLYKVTAGSDRMGIRHEGVKIDYSEKSLLSCPITIGSVQVPPSGQPIIVMADGQVTGGYPVVANVISIDMKNLAQIKPNRHLRFKVTTLDNAVELLRAEKESFKDLWK